jgi:hypothetical protein
MRSAAVFSSRFRMPARTRTRIAGAPRARRHAARHASARAVNSRARIAAPRTHSFVARVVARRHRPHVDERQFLLPVSMH